MLYNMLQYKMITLSFGILFYRTLYTMTTQWRLREMLIFHMITV